MARVVVTGVSSYTGACIARAIAARGHQVLGLCHRPRAGYQGLAQRRLALAEAAGTRLLFDLEARDFPQWALGQTLDAWVHHHHPMENFRSPSYDRRAAEDQVQGSLPALFHNLHARGARLVVYSSTYFEPGEGGQAEGAPVTPYAALKAQLYLEIEAASSAAQLSLSRVVIPAPTGALENVDRLTPQLLISAERSQPFVLRSPDSIMDLVPGEDLAERYADLVDEGMARSKARTLRPSGLVISAADWARKVDERLVRQLGHRLDLNIPAEPDRSPAVRFENPSSERMTIDWDAFFERYRREWRTP